MLFDNNRVVAIIFLALTIYMAHSQSCFVVRAYTKSMKDEEKKVVGVEEASRSRFKIVFSHGVCPILLRLDRGEHIAQRQSGAFTLRIASYIRQFLFAGIFLLHRSQQPYEVVSYAFVGSFIRGFLFHPIQDAEQSTMSRPFPLR